MKHRSSTYAMTVTNDQVGKDKIAALRTDCKILNAKEKIKSLEDPSYVRKIRRVTTYGRLGKNNPNAPKYREEQKRSWRNAYARIAVADAATLDVYMTTYIEVTYMKYDNSGLVKGLKYCY